MSTVTQTMMPATTNKTCRQAKSTRRLTFAPKVETTIPKAPAIESAAARLLEQHPHFRGRRHGIRFRSQGNRLIIEGNLPSYFLKQLAQEAVRSLADRRQIDNQIAVAGVLYDK